MPTGRQGGPGSPARPGKELYSMRVLCYVDDPDSVARGRTSHSHWQPQGPSPCGLPSHGSHQGLRHSVALSERQCAQVAVTLRCDSGGSFWFGQMPGWGIGLGFLPPRDRRPAFCQCPTPLAAKFFARRMIPGGLRVPGGLGLGFHWQLPSQLQLGVSLTLNPNPRLAAMAAAGVPLRHWQRPTELRPRCTPLPQPV